MIKVISVPGVPKHMKHQYKVTCKHCGTIFECDEEDFHEEIAGFHDTDYIVNCPTCQDWCSNRLSPYACTIEVIQ